MSDLAGQIRTYYDSAAEPVTAAEILRMGEPTMVDLQTKSTEDAPDGGPPRHRLPPRAVAWAAVVLLIVGVAGAVIITNRDDSPPTIAANSPEAVVDSYFAAFNAGQTELVLSLVAPDAVLTERFGPSGSFDQSDRAGWEEEIEGFIAQEAVVTSRSCAEIAGEDINDTTISCTYELLDGLTLAVGALPMPVTSTFVVTSGGGISEIQLNYDQLDTGIDFVHAGRPFGRWLAENHPDFAGLATTDERFDECCESMSASGLVLLKLEYAQLWADYLKANDCGYLDGC